MGLKLGYATASKQSVDGVKWQRLQPDKKQNWLDMGLREEFDDFMLLVAKDSKGQSESQPTIFSSFGRGLESARDDWVYGFDRKVICKRIASTIDYYNDHVRRYARLAKKPKVDNFVDNDPSKIGWSSSLKAHLERGIELKFQESAMRDSLYRPFSRKQLYFDSRLNHRVGIFPEAFPRADTKNCLLSVTDAGSEKPFMILASDTIADLHLVGAGASHNVFHFMNTVRAPAGMNLSGATISLPKRARYFRFSTQTTTSLRRIYSITSMRCCITPLTAPVSPRI